MELHSLRLKNFRQYADATLLFERGLTGIIGTNGAGKSTILEAIAFALYGVQAARGSKDSIKHRRAAARASVSVELVFSVGAHLVRVERGLSSASVFLGASATPVATSLGGVTEWIERTLGMTRAEFFTTYFTGQKELAVMGSLGPADRARFLSRVLGYDRLEAAQSLVRDARRALVSEATGLRASTPDAATLEDDLRAAEWRWITARDAMNDAVHATAAAAAVEAQLRPTWDQAQATRTEQQTIETRLGAVQLREEALARDVQRLQAESTAIAEALAALPTIEADLATLPALREEGARLDREAAADTERQRLLGTLDHLEALIEQEETAEVLHATEAERNALVAEETAKIVQWTTRAEQSQRRLGEEEAAWRDLLAAARAELQQARAAVRPLLAKRDALLARGADAECSTCGVALGDRFAVVLAALESEIATATAEGTRLNAEALALETEPDAVAACKRERDAAAGTLQQVKTQLSEAQLALREVQLRQTDRQRLEADVARLTAQIAALPTTYDVARHAIVREELARLAPLEARRAVLADKAAGHERVREALAQTETQQRAIASERADLEERLAALGMTGEQFESIRREYTEAERAWRVAVDAERTAKDAADRAADALKAAHRRIDETAAARARLVAIEKDRVLHEELDRAMGELRADLNGALRPELADLASGLLEALTDGRYTHAEFGEDYQLTLVEDGLVKPVISGGEEDLCNLVLRLAISQMVAERSGTPFSLLILDEVFAALDEQRRANVLTLLRRLSDRFAQVIVITHDASVRDALDHLVRVTLDVETGTSRVHSGAAIAALEQDAPVLELAA
jgi:DNA repair protein SbcC/Rad50